MSEEGLGKRKGGGGGGGVESIGVPVTPLTPHSDDMPVT